MALCFVIDDDDISCDASAQAIKSIGMHVKDFVDPIEALNACKEKLPDLILIDMKMPMMDGFAFIKAIHKMHGGINVKIIVCTGLHDIETVKKLQAEGISDYLVKPFDNDLLIKKVNKLKLW